MPEDYITLHVSNILNASCRNYPERGQNVSQIREALDKIFFRLVRAIPIKRSALTQNNWPLHVDKIEVGENRVWDLPQSQNKKEDSVKYMDK